VTILTRFLPHITLTFSDLTSSCVCVTLHAPDRARVLTPTWAASVVFFFLAQDPPKSPPQIPSFEHSCQCWLLSSFGMPHHSITVMSNSHQWSLDVVIWLISPCLVLPLSLMACPSKSLVSFMDGYISIGHSIPCPSPSSVHFVVVYTSTVCVASLVIPTMPPWLVKLAPNTLAFDCANNFVMNNSTWTFNCSIPQAFELHASFLITLFQLLQFMRREWLNWNPAKFTCIPQHNYNLVQQTSLIIEHHRGHGKM